LVITQINDEFIYTAILEYVYTDIVINHNCGLLFGSIVIAVTINSSILIILATKLGVLDSFYVFKAFIYIFSVHAINLIASYTKEKQER
jgi:predicted transporter